MELTLRKTTHGDETTIQEFEVDGKSVFLISNSAGVDFAIHDGGQRTDLDMIEDLDPFWTVFVHKIMNDDYYNLTEEKEVEMEPFTNYTLLRELQKAGRVFNAACQPLEDDDFLRYGSPPIAIEVQEDDSYSGHTHEWVAQKEGGLNLHDVAYARPWCISLYLVGEVYGGPEEGGWWTYPEELHAVWPVFANENTSLEDLLEVAASWATAEFGEKEDARYGDRWYVISENIPGWHHTVGSTYYC